MTASPRKIIHVDMDAFFASVEQRDRPELRGKPVVVGGSPQSRGVVCAASYEAREFGVRSAIPCSQAARKCPGAIFVAPRFERYREVSHQIREVFALYTDLIEPLSLDEAYLDVTEDRTGAGSATAIAEEIRAAIKERTQLTASAGVAPNKFLAKVASDVNKPDGICIIKPDQIEAFVAMLPVRRVPGIGKVTAERCQELGIVHCSDFLRLTEQELSRHFGRHGYVYHRLARGIDDRPVVPHSKRKSLGIEDTFATDIEDFDRCWQEIERLAEGLEHRAHAAEISGYRLTVKVKYGDFRTVTRSRTLPTTIAAAADVLPIARDLLRQTEAGQLPVRLLGLSLGQLVDPDSERQLGLPFDEDASL